MHYTVIVSSSLPSTPVIKPIEIWLLFNLGYPFLIITISTFFQVFLLYVYDFLTKSWFFRESKREARNVKLGPTTRSRLQKTYHSLKRLSHISFYQSFIWHLQYHTLQFIIIEVCILVKYQNETLFCSICVCLEIKCYCLYFKNK